MKEISFIYTSYIYIYKLSHKRKLTYIYKLFWMITVCGIVVPWGELMTSRTELICVLKKHPTYAFIIIRLHVRTLTSPLVIFKFPQLSCVLAQIY